MQFPLVAPLAAFVAGIVAAQHAQFSFRELSVSILLLLVLALVGLLRGATRVAALACIAGFALVGALWCSLPVSTDPELITGVVERESIDLREPLRLRGWVQVPPTVRLDRDQFVLALESLAEATPAHGGVRVSVLRRSGESPVELHYGDRVEVLARLRCPRNYENPGGFDRVEYLLRNGVHMTASVRAGVPFTRLAGRGGSRFMALVWRAREWAEARVDSLLGANSVQAGVVKAMVLGDGAYLDRALGVSFQRTGTYHVLVVSGSHIALLAWFFLPLFRRIRISRGLASLATMVLLIGFVLLLGSQLPAIRAACMVGAYMVARLFYRQRRALNIMAATALAMLLVNPADLFDVAFQLSFLSVALIAGVAMPLLERTLEPYRAGLIDVPNRDRDIHLPPKVAQARIEWRMLADRLPFRPLISLAMVCRAVGILVAVGELLVISASVQLGLALPMAVYFHRVSWSGLSANIFIVPLMSLIVPMGFLAITTGWGWLGRIVSGLVLAMIRLVEWHARLTWLEARVPAPPLWLGIGFAAALVLLAWALRKRRVPQLLAFVVLIFSVAGLVLHPFRPKLDPGRLELTALDVGQGEALFLALPQGQTMLVDGGGVASFGANPVPPLDIGEEVVSPYLWSRSVRALDVVAISHAHYDHIGGLPALLENFGVRELWVGKNPVCPDYERVLAVAKQRSVRVIALSKGDVRSLGSVSFQVLAPDSEYVPRNKPSNDDSLVLLARYGERSFLLPGDIERRSEQWIAAGGLLPRIDVIKVPHHGSKTSANEFLLAQARPWLGVVSAGFDNPYGHPHPDLLARLAAFNVKVFRTDRDGAVTISTDGHRVSVDTFRWNQGSNRKSKLSMLVGTPLT